MAKKINQHYKRIAFVCLILATIGLAYTTSKYISITEKQNNTIMEQKTTIGEHEKTEAELTKDKQEFEKTAKELEGKEKELKQSNEEKAKENQTLENKVNELNEALKTKQEKQLAESKKAEVVVAETSANPEKTEEITETKEPVKEEVLVPTQDTNFKATFYAVGDNFTPGTVTANGTDVSNTIYSPEGHRIIAVDPSVIPLNSIVEVTYNGETFTAKASDTGSAINGNKIDILVSDAGEANANGLVPVHVKVID